MPLSSPGVVRLLWGMIPVILMLKNDEFKWNKNGSLSFKCGLGGGGWVGVGGVCVCAALHFHTRRTAT